MDLWAQELGFATLRATMSSDKKLFLYTDHDPQVVALIESIAPYFGAEVKLTHSSDEDTQELYVQVVTLCTAEEQAAIDTMVRVYKETYDGLYSRVAG